MDSKSGEETISIINNEIKGASVFQKTDVSKNEDCLQMVNRAEKEFGKLTTIFNNAGIMMNEDDDAINTDEKTWEKTFAINVKGVFLGCKHAIPEIKKAGGGSIINTASFVSIVGAATPQLAYTSSKGAVLAMTREIAVIHARQNIRANNLCPGPLNTPLLQKFLDNDAKKARRLVHVPMGRFGEAEEMAQGFIFLASNESSYMTGSNLILDGGITSAYVTPEEKVDPFGGPAHKRKH